MIPFRIIPSADRMWGLHMIQPIICIQSTILTIGATVFMTKIVAMASRLAVTFYGDLVVEVIPPFLKFHLIFSWCLYFIYGDMKVWNRDKTHQEFCETHSSSARPNCGVFQNRPLMGFKVQIHHTWFNSNTLSHLLSMDPEVLSTFSCH